VVLSTSCRVTRLRCAELYPAPPPDTITTTIVEYKERVRDTVIYSTDDEAWFTALLQCDSSYQVAVSELTKANGKFAKVNQTITRNKNHLRLQFQCQCDSQAIYFTWRERDTTDRTAATIVKNYPVPVPADLTWWQKFKITYGGYAIGTLSALLLVLIGGAVLKYYLKFQIPFLQ
jgi:hypothetical protein